MRWPAECCQDRTARRCSGPIGLNVNCRKDFASSRRIMDIEGKVAVVTGAGSGIGQALAAALAEEGARVVVGDIDGGAAQRTAQTIADRGHHAVSAEADASADGDIGALIGL